MGSRAAGGFGRWIPGIATEDELTHVAAGQRCESGAGH